MYTYAHIFSSRPVGLLVQVLVPPRRQYGTMINPRPSAGLPYDRADSLLWQLNFCQIGKARNEKNRLRSQKETKMRVCIKDNQCQTVVLLIATLQTNMHIWHYLIESFKP